MIIAREPWSSLWPECEPLMKAHWNEVRENRAGLRFKVNLPMVERIDQAKLMICIGAREAGALVGYLIWFITPHMESLGNIMATMGPFFTLPEYEGIGRSMWNMGLGALRAEGVPVAYVHYSVKGPRQDKVRRFFELAGAQPYETKLELVL